MRYIQDMVIQMRRIKCIVTAFLAIACLSGPSMAQQTVLDEKFQELLDADDTTHSHVANEIIAEFERSGSPAMDLLYRRGSDAMDEGDYGAAVEHFTALIDHAPDFSEGYHGRASAYFYLGYVGPALDDLRRVLELQPRHFTALYGLGAVMEALERPEDAMEVYETVIDIYPLEPDALAAIERLKLVVEGQSL